MKSISWLKLLILAPLLLLLTACPGEPPAEEDCGFVVNSKGRRVSWARMPVRFYVDDTLTNAQYDAIQEAMDVWNEEFEAPVFELIGLTSKLPEPVIDASGDVVPDGYNGIYIVDATVFENSRSRDEQARTGVSYRGDFIFEADILIDGSEDFYIGDFAVASTERKVEFKSLMIHELGHALGLSHFEGPGNPVMQAKLGYGEVRHELSDADFQALDCEY